MIVVRTAASRRETAHDYFFYAGGVFGYVILRLALFSRNLKSDLFIMFLCFCSFSIDLYHNIIIPRLCTLKELPFTVESTS